MSRPLPVTTLLGHSQVPMALDCLGSLQRRCRDPHELLVFDDGSLTSQDRDEVEQRLGARIVSNEEVDDIVAPRLRAYPTSAAFRRDHVFGPKLFDIPLYVAATADGTYAYTDTDVLFTRPFSGLDRRETGETVVMMRDEWDSAVMTFRDRYLGGRKLRIPEKACAGFMFVRGGTFDLDVVESFLREPAYWHRAPERLIEQIAWGALAARAGGRYWDREQVVMPLGDVVRHARTSVVLHFATPVRAGLDAGVQASLDNRSNAVLRTEPLEVTSVWQAVARRITSSAA